MTFKEELFYQLWKEQDKNALEQWIYNANSIDFENCVGEKSYLEIISEYYADLTIKKIKQLVFNSLSAALKEDFKLYVKNNQKVIKAICVKNICLDYDGIKERKWDLEIGKEYYVLGIFVNIKRTSSPIHFQIFNPKHSTTYPYFIPSELFEVNNSVIPPDYSLVVKDGNIQIEPKEFTNKAYTPVEYSFWEDYFDDYDKAVKTFKSTIARLDIDLELENNGE